ncbi:regulator of microtubule dynamics protein 1-like [Brevipalpus obovatus]|uniref:regulator of microtubule dynamics protein 1-like n=1 Tax=Brevipalpus obovatus TaxID=246614 RepID=UPI003D9F8B70
MSCDTSSAAIIETSQAGQQFDIDGPESKSSLNGTLPTYEEWLAEIDREVDDMKVDKVELLEKIMEGYERFNGSENTEILWRVARNLFRLGCLASAKGQKEEEKKYFMEAEKYIKKALDKDAEKPIHHAFAAYISGKLSYFVGQKERIQRGNEVYHHLEEAIRLGANDAGVYLAFGRLCIEVAKLTWIERKLASIIFSKPPEVTYQDALDKFTEADELEPDTKVIHFWMAKAHIAMKNYDKAIRALDTAAKCNPKREEDLTIEEELASLQEKYASYR